MKTHIYLIIILMVLSQSLFAQIDMKKAIARERFIPGEIWPDNNGIHINAHGGGFLFHEGTYYWFGEHKTAGRGGNRANVGVHCYSSVDLCNWKDESIVLAVSDDTNSDIIKGCVIERPKVIYNRKTGKFVMWFHLELRGQGYNAARTGVAVSDKITGPYVFLRSLRPNANTWPEGFTEEKKKGPNSEEGLTPWSEPWLKAVREGLFVSRDFKGGQMSRDMTLFVDDDGKAYHIHASEENLTLHISQLSDDYLSFNGHYIRIFPGGHNEAPAIFKRKGKYYMITSGCTGWSPNPARSAVADSIWGPWKSLGNPCVGVNPQNSLGPEKTFGGQSTFVLPVPGKSDAFIAMFDVWRPNNAIDGRYLWLPLVFKDDEFKVSWHNEWDLSIFEKSTDAAEKSSVRIYEDFDFDWRFSRGDFVTAMMPGFDDSSWRTVNLPHDWSIEGPFGADYGSGNGYAPGGLGWYRRHFRLDPIHKDKVVAIEFDGVYHNSEVWINGHFVGRRPYGYSSFQYDLTPHVRFGSDENIVAVRVDHSRFADSRWYTGSGIYRYVRLRLTDKLHIAHWGNYVTTPEINKESALVRVETTIKNGYDKAQDFSLQSDIITTEGLVAGSMTTSYTVDADREQTLVQQITIDHPRLWSIETPAMYVVQNRVIADSGVIDQTSTPFGIRSIRFDPQRGFFLNDQQVKIKGVCLHHDAGCLGAAVPEKVLERRLRLLKELGANAVRTSHNPPAPELLDLCDRLGLLVKDEAFDEFTPPKNKWVSGWNVGEPSRFGYGEVFARWSVIDMQDMVRRDRNHPCVIMWSIGNEIDYPNDPFSHPVLGGSYRPDHPTAKNLLLYSKPLVEAVKKWDRTRPVTAGLASIPVSEAVGLTELLDVVGYNYQENRYQNDHQKHPQRFIYGSETGDSYNSWTVVRDNDYVAGQFLWTGIDYLGEAGRWPNRANGAGLLDLCGFKKPIAWFRQSLWSDEPMVYICASGSRSRRTRGSGGFEHWNWPKNQIITILCYTNCPEMSLELNHELIGTRQLSEATQGVQRWEIPYKKGVLRAVGRKSGRVMCEYFLKTAGPASRIELLPDATQLRANGKDICHLEFQIVDDQGVRVPDAGPELMFEVTGPGQIIGIENGNLNNLEDYQDQVQRAYRGRGLAILQSTTVPGQIKVKVTSDGLESATLFILSQK
ncbi:glycoside hydrolase family 2 TIM barrel-domain containing protein [Planctomycetota bacterium]